MARELRYNTAIQVTVGPFRDKTDGVTIENSLTITNEKITLVADTDDGNAPTIILDNVTGATSGTDNDLNYISNCDAGLMRLELTAANLQRYGRLLLTIDDANNHVPVFHEFEVISQEVYDAKYGTGNLPANSKAISGDSTAADNLESACDGTGYNIGNGAVVALITPGTGTGQIDLTSGVIKANLCQILGTALTETAGYIAAAFKKLFNVGTPVLTCESVNQSGDAYAKLPEEHYH